jgi:arsenite oxidase small subunit
MILPIMGWAVLTVILQIGDIITAPQYGMTPQHFAGYLFGLWAFDGLLLMQGIVIGLGLFSRSFLKMARKKKQLTYFDMGIKSSRRDFLQIGSTIGAFFVIAAALGIWTTLSPTRNQQGSGNSHQSTQTSTLPSGAVANTRDLLVGSPSYFDYPSTGDTNILLKKTDGTVSAINILCTHVCCQCQYDRANEQLYCPCHGSIFDLNGNVLQGPAPTNLPSIQLNIDSNGNVFPIKVAGSSPCIQ